MGLDYRHTCPDINDSIEGFKNEIYSHLDSLLNDSCPLFQGNEKNEFIETYVDDIYNSFEDNFESVRKTNEDMRREADRQIDNAESELSNANDDIKYLNKEISDLEDRISELENQ